MTTHQYQHIKITGARIDTISRAPEALYPVVYSKAALDRIRDLLYGALSRLSHRQRWHVGLRSFLKLKRVPE